MSPQYSYFIKIAEIIGQFRDKKRIFAPFCIREAYHQKF
ncbi:hypothetical protein ASZ90_010310 [hydrocarbon metagenome]|uniref:Uncharacterized protein n=1 Tax=hydrocarbon metagenome TaxID=938273 RepID=A0A0W8FGH0_9ZZZZ